MKIREKYMSTKNRKKRADIARTMFAFLVTVCLTTGMVFADFGGGTPFANTGRSSYSHNGRFSDSIIVNGVDISDWQSKNCDFAAAKNAGVDFAIMKVTGTYYGRKKLTCYNDSNFAAQYSNAKANGVMTGVYVFSQATNASEGAQEAQFAINRLSALGISPKDLQMPVYMDYEFAGGRFGRMKGLKRNDATAAAAAFCNTIKAAGYTPGIYASSSFYSSYIDMSALAPDVDIWVAQYYSRCQSGTNYTKWQYTSSAKIDGMLSFLGYKGRIDADFWYISKTINPSPITEIYGKTTFSTEEAKSPHFRIYSGGTLLTEGVDYVTGGIRNNAMGSGYIYIKGIGAYAGYALIPITIAESSSGDENSALNGVAANYITAASDAMSAVSAAPETVLPESAETVSYEVGGTYTTQEALKVRTGPSTSYRWKNRSELTAEGRRSAKVGSKAIMKKGTQVTCLEISGDWMRVPSGWICCRDGDDIYVK